MGMSVFIKDNTRFLLDVKAGWKEQPLMLGEGRPHHTALSHTLSRGLHHNLEEKAKYGHPHFADEEN